MESSNISFGVSPNTEIQQTTKLRRHPIELKAHLGQLAVTGTNHPILRVFRGDRSLDGCQEEGILNIPGERKACHKTDIWIGM